MKLAIGSDHGGFDLKEAIKEQLTGAGISFYDFGTYSGESVDYPDIAFQLGEAVAKGDYDKGILFCGTGVGISIAANKVHGVRAANCHDVYSARMSREHNDANVLTLGGRVIGAGLAWEVVKIWLKTEFVGGRHGRRVDKIGAYDAKR